MSEKMLITQALDERDLLVKKIRDKIHKASFVDTIRPNEDKVYAKRVSREDFEKEAKAAYQQIADLTTRFQRLDAAITESNAITMIHTSYGDFTISAALSLKRRMNAIDSYLGDADFEDILQNKISDEYKERVSFCDSKNRDLESTAETMRLSILGKENKTKDEKPLTVVDTYVKENKMELVDPLDVRKKLDAIAEKRESLMTELETQIKVSNATTFIEI